MSTNPQFPVLLNVTFSESDRHCDIKADITGFRAKEVRVTTWDDSLVVEMDTENESPQSFYLGESDPVRLRRIIPLGFKADSNRIMTHYQGGKLDINVMKQVSESAVEASKSSAAS